MGNGPRHLVSALALGTDSSHWVESGHQPCDLKRAGPLPVQSVAARGARCHEDVTAPPPMDRHTTTLIIMRWVTSWELILLVAAAACLVGSLLLL